MPPSGIDLREFAPRNLGFLVPVTLVGAVLALVAPLPAGILDLLLAANLTAAVVMLLQTIQVRRPRDFHVFPALLLATTLVRLVLNVASTRLILTRAPSEGVDAAGGVIAAFGEFVAGGSPLVGGVIFAILVAIQFLVITKGATRISEVAARFALDGMPGRQAAVDADLHSGLISADEARDRREAISQQADFYGAMDGASKFVRGDAIAGLVITLVNILGGLAVGVMQEGMELGEALSIYTTLTIGDGLVSQIPAFLISLAAGLIVTRSSKPADLSRDVIGQLLMHPAPLMIAAAFLLAMAAAGFPLLPTLALAACCALGGWMLLAPAAAADSSAAPATVQTQEPPQPRRHDKQSPKLERHLRVEPLDLDLGVSLVRLADRACGGDLLERVASLRDRIAADLGFILPKVRIQDDLRLDPRQFRLKLRGVPAASGTAYADAVLAVDDGFVASSLEGIDAVEPATGRRGKWIEQGRAEEAKRQGFRIVPPQGVILQMVEQAVRRHAGELITREHVHDLLGHLRQRAPRLVEDLVPGRISETEILRVLAALLSEEAPIHDLEAILEATAEAAVHDRSLENLVAAARFVLRRTIAERLTEGRGVLHAVVLDNPHATCVSQALASTAALRFDRDQLVRTHPWFQDLLAALERLEASGRPAVIVCHADLRPAVRELLQRAGTSAAVLGHRELLPEIELKVHHEISAAPVPHAPELTSAMPVAA
jgi:flagellar biosynthesis protein FlhA